MAEAHSIARNKLTAAEYHEANDELTAAGYRVTYISGCEVEYISNYSVVWTKSDDQDCVVGLELSKFDYEAFFEEQTAKGYRLAIVNGYSFNEQEHFVALFDKTSHGDAKWCSHCALTQPQFQANFDKYNTAGLTLQHLSVYEVGAEAHYAAIWNQTPAAVSQYVRSRLNAADHAQTNQQMRDQHFYIHHLNVFQLGGTLFYATIWRKGDTAYPEMSRAAMSEQEFNSASLDYQRRGFTPTRVNVCSVFGAGSDDEEGEEESLLYCAQWENRCYSAQQLHQWDDIFSSFRQRHNLPALSMAITFQGRLVYAQAFGVADQQTGAVAHTDTLFRIASCSKPITAITCCKLADMGLLDLDATVFGEGGILGTRFGTQPYSAQLEQVTVRQLLSHTSGGYRGWSGDSGQDVMFMNYAMGHDELISWVLDTFPLENEPGAKYSYSNFGYLLLGRVIEAVTGDTYENWISENILAPCGIDDMRIAGNTKADQAPNEAWYYDVPFPNAPEAIHAARMDAHGGWLATAVDMVRLLSHCDGLSHQSDSLLTAERIAEMTKPVLNNYALGWNVQNQVWFHSGRMSGTASQLIRLWNGMNVFMVTNTRDGDPMQHAMQEMQLAWTNVHWSDRDLF